MLIPVCDVCMLVSTWQAVSRSWGFIPNQVSAPSEMAPHFFERSTNITPYSVSRVSWRQSYIQVHWSLPDPNFSITTLEREKLFLMLSGWIWITVNASSVSINSLGISVQTETMLKKIYWSLADSNFSIFLLRVKTLTTGYFLFFKHE